MQAELQKFHGIEHVKTDLIGSKGIAFAKFKAASSALRAKEEIEKNSNHVCTLPVDLFEFSWAYSASSNIALAMASSRFGCLALLPDSS